MQRSRIFKWVSVFGPLQKTSSQHNILSRTRRYYLHKQKLTEIFFSGHFLRERKYTRVIRGPLPFSYMYPSTLSFCQNIPPLVTKSASAELYIAPIKATQPLKGGRNQEEYVIFTKDVNFHRCNLHPYNSLRKVWLIA